MNNFKFVIYKLFRNKTVKFISYEKTISETLEKVNSLNMSNDDNSFIYKYEYEWVWAKRKK